MQEIDIDIEDEITPAHLQCGPGSCPGVYTLSDGNLLIIGKKPAEALSRRIEGRVAADEFAIVLSPDYFQKLNTAS